MTGEYQMLIWSVILGMAQLMIVATIAVKVYGHVWAFSPRDLSQAPLPGVGGRLERAFYNFMETFPFFAVLVLLTGALNVHTALTGWGAMLYFWARLAYIPVYAVGIPVLRTGIWAVSVAGMIMLLAALF